MARSTPSLVVRRRLAEAEPVARHGRHAHRDRRVLESMSKDLKRRGFRFVGPTVCYAFMQATGMVQPHVASCFRYEELKDAT